MEKQSIVAELTTALFVSSAGMVLKLGIASVALTGAVLLVQGSIDVLTLFLFLMAASRMYDPMQGALQNLAAVIAMRTNVGRMNEILQRALHKMCIRDRVKAYIHGVESAALDDVFELLAWNQGIGFFSSELGPSALFQAYKLINNGEKQGKSREDICSALREKFGEKNPEMQVLH